MKTDMSSKPINDLLAELEPKNFIERLEMWYWSFHHWIGFSSIWRFKPIFIWQHITRGFPEYHLWYLNHKLAEHIAPRMRAFADYKLCGCPNDYYDKYGEVGFAKWKRDIHKMAFVFEKLADCERNWMDAAEIFKSVMTDEERVIWFKVMEVRRNYVQKNVEHFGKCFMDLWD